MKQIIILLSMVALMIIGVGCAQHSQETQHVSNEPTTTNIEDASDDVKEGTGHSPFYLLGNAFSKTKSQLLVALELMGGLLLVLSFCLYLAEHHAQPNVYKHYTTSLLWTFVKCIQDPGDMAPARPVTFVGRVIANVIGLLGVAIFAIPAGIISSGFTGAMEEERRELEVKENIERVHHGLRWTKSPSGLYAVPAFVPMENLVTKQFMSTDDIIEAVKESPELQLYNLAKAYNTEDATDDRLVIVACPHNRPYGCCIDRGSTVTIVSPSGQDEPITSWVAYHIALMGGFNYVAKQIEPDPDNPISYAKFSEDEMHENLRLFLDDINRLSSRENSWVVQTSFCIGPKTRVEKLHLCYSKVKKDEGYSPENITLKDSVTFEQLYLDMDTTMTNKYDMPCDKNLYYTVADNALSNWIDCKNSFKLMAECHVIYFAANRLEMIQSMTQVLARHLEPGVDKPIPEVMNNKPKQCFSYRGYE